MPRPELLLDELGLGLTWVRRAPFSAAPAPAGAAAAPDTVASGTPAAALDVPAHAANTANTADTAAIAHTAHTAPASEFDVDDMDRYIPVFDDNWQPAGDARADTQVGTGVDAQANEIAMLDWAALKTRVAGCQRCRLCETRNKTVFGVGDEAADWMVIGEGPGANEDRKGEPFVGDAGKLLDNMLAALGLGRSANVYIANVVKCRPPGNRDPQRDEVARCAPYLKRQVALIRPKVIVALGKFAAQTLLQTGQSVGALRGQVHAFEEVPVVVTYHPAYLLRSPADKGKAWTDLCLARATYRAQPAAHHQA